MTRHARWADTAGPRTRRRPGDRCTKLVLLASWPLAAGVAPAAAAGLAEAVPYAVVGAAIPQSLTGEAGDAARGRAIVVSRQRGACLLCHSGPFPDEPGQGDLAPSLAGVGERLDAGELRLRLVLPQRINPQTIMPSYQRIDGLQRVGTAWRARPLLSAQDVEDVIALLATLRD